MTNFANKLNQKSMQKSTKKAGENMVHTYKLNGYNIAIDVNSGAVHLLDEISYEIVTLLKDFIGENDNNANEIISEKINNKVLNILENKYNISDINSAYSEIFSLCSSGKLFSADILENCAECVTNAPIKSMCLNVAHDCNLRCDYCFAAKGDFGTGRELMSFEIAKKAIDFLVENSANRHNLEVDFFGGEPLMNFEVVKKTVDYARSLEQKYSKNFRFTITTNGILLTDDKIDYINKEMSNVVLSLDGRKNVNDKLRVTPNGKGCYDVIVQNYQKLINSRSKDKDYYVRGTFTKNNLDFTNDVLHMYELGFDQLSIEPVVTDTRLSYALTEDDLPRIFLEYEKLAKTIIEYRKNDKFFNFFHFMIDLEHGPCAIKLLKGCGCGNEYVAITPNGDIYPCHQFVGMGNWKLGNLNKKTFNNELKAFFATTNICTKPECKNCWAKFYCGGGCNANSVQYAGDIFKPHKISCALEKKRVECAIMLKAALAEL